MIIKSYGFDEKAQWATEEKAQTLCRGGGAGWYSLVMTMTEEPLIFRDDPTPKVGGRCPYPQSRTEGMHNHLSDGSRNA